MADAAQLYAPVRRGDGGVVDVVLGADHPGFSDPLYRARRNALAELALDWRPGDPVPEPQYDEVEHNVWRVVARELEPLHARSACRAYLEGKEELGLPTDRVPQLREVTERLSPITGFRYLPVAGLAPLRDFYGAFAGSVFFSTQYLRHPSMPLYTPEPDLIHEVIGHGNLLASPRFAEIKRQAGLAAQRVETEEALQFLADVFWFTIEFGVLREDGEVRAYGAGLLSSYGEIEEFRGAELRPLDLLEMGTIEYDITHYQPVLFAAPSFEFVVNELGHFFRTFDDRSVAAA